MLAPIVVSSFPNAKALPLWVGDEHGIFERFGLKLSIDLTPGSDAQREKLVDGRIDIAQAAVDNALQLIIEGHDVIIAMGGESGMNDFIVQADVNGYADFRGRNLVVDAPNTAYALLARKLLARAGLKPGEDYQIKPIGNAGMRFRALLDDNANAGAVMNPPFSSEAVLRGMKSLGHLTDLLGPYQAGGAFLLRDWAMRNSRTLENYIGAYVASLRWIFDPANKAGSIKILVEKLKLSQAVAQAAYAQLTDPGFGFTPDAKLSMDGIANMLSTRAETEGRNARLDDETAYVDESWYMRALARMPV
jgi:ABC-type nitrate/sulfonate/bicarbonate transport system substrate-binding protein